VKAATLDLVSSGPVSSSADLSFGLLGPTTVTGDAGEIEIHGIVRRRLLARLLVTANRPVPVERLREDLWEGDLPQSAASTLKSHVSLLRRVLGPDRLVHRDGAYLLRVEPDELDVFLFEREALAGRELLRNGDPKGAADALGRGLARWRGPALAEVAHASWAQPEAVRLEELRAACLEGWLEARLAVGETHELIADAEAAITEHPLREGLWAKLITALYRSGRQADALRTYQRLREILGDELGIAPSRELVVLEGAILRQDLEPAPIDASQQSARVGLGRRTNNLPPELTSFVPRPAVQAEVAALLEASRLVTLTGAGGTGKTRLALRVAADAADGYDGVWLCELAPLEDPADVPRELAAAIGCREQPDVELSRTIADRLAEGTNLLILDNCEHLIDAAAAVTAPLLEAAPSLRVLATSRSPLRVVGEVVHRVPSMSVPGPEATSTALEDYEAVRLFVERAKSQRGDFAIAPANAVAVASVCVRLDGIPLALELAAARMRTMSVVDIERHLDDRFRLLTGGARTAPARQQRLESLIDWSHDLLNEQERAVLRRLTVFAGGFDLVAAEAVAACSLVDRRDVLDVVASLVDKSLLQVDTSGITARYRMLETVRAYATLKMDEEERQSARSAHAHHFLRVVEVAAPHFSGADQLEWRTRLEYDHDNLRSAFATLIAPAEHAALALRFGVAVSRFWNSRGYYGDEVDLLQAALGRTDATPETAVRAAALNAAGYLMFRRGESSLAQRFLDEALRIGRHLGSPALVADSLRTAAWVADRRGDRRAAAALASEAVEAAEASGEAHLLARAYDVRAAASQNEDPEAARADYAEALRYCRASGDGLGQASALNNLAVLDLEQGDNLAARQRFSEALAIAGDVRDAALVPFLEYGVGLAACLAGDHRTAEPAFVSALLAARRTGQRSLVAYGLLGMCAVLTAGGRAAEAAVLLGASSALFEELGEQPERIETGLRERVVASLRGELGAGLDEVIEDGRRLPGAEVLRLATEGL
jgi:predicted ATPase/DNA-binding SARP family transcriptional activator